MTEHLRVTGQIPEPVRLMQEVDQAVEHAVKQVRPVVLSAYQRHAPGRIGAAVVGRIKDLDGWQLVVTVAGTGMAKPAAYWTDQGTGIYRPGGFPIRRRNGKPFVVRGRGFREFKGQKAQNWVPDARREADARAAVIVEHHMPEQVTEQVRRWLG